MRALRIILITGMSGSGKTVAIHALEDIGYFCIDNMPLALLPKLLELMINNPTVKGLALVADAREPGFPGNATQILEELRNQGHQVEILFLEAEEKTLLRRYVSSRRTHPMAAGGTVQSGIDRERELLKDLRDSATFILNTSDLNVHDLGRMLTQRFGPAHGIQRLNIFVLSFGYKYGLPQEADLVFDVRFMANPFFIDDLRAKTGLDPEVTSFVLADPSAIPFLNRLLEMLRMLIPKFDIEGKYYLTIAIGCTGGKHRSVTVAEYISRELTSDGFRVSVRHRDIEKG